MTDRSHYRKTSPTTTIDVYRVLVLFGVTDPCIQHAVKKLLAAGQRGSKDADADIAEAIEALQRWQEMRQEEARLKTAPNATAEADNSRRKVLTEAAEQLDRDAEFHSGSFGIGVAAAAKRLRTMIDKPTLGEAIESLQRWQEMRQEEVESTQKPKRLSDKSAKILVEILGEGSWPADAVNAAVREALSILQPDVLK